MWFMLALLASVIVGPETLTSLCGITSLFTTVRTLPFARVIDCDALYGPPLTDQVWQPRTWCLIVSVAPDRGLAGAASTRTAAAAARNEMRFMVPPFVSRQRGPSEGRGDRAAR